MDDSEQMMKRGDEIIKLTRMLVKKLMEIEDKTELMINVMGINRTITTTSSLLLDKIFLEEEKENNELSKAFNKFKKEGEE